MQLETTVSNKTSQAQHDRCSVQTEADMRREAGLPRKGLATAEAEKWDPMGENMATINGSHEETVLMKHITVYNKYSETKTFIFNGGIKGLESQLSGEEDLFFHRTHFGPSTRNWQQQLSVTSAPGGSNSFFWPLQSVHSRGTHTETEAMRTYKHDQPGISVD